MSIPTTQQIARQLAAMLELTPDKTTSELAHELGYSPLFIINAISEGVKMKLFYEIKEDDKLIAEEGLEYKDTDNIFGDESERLQDEILRVVSDANKKQQDIELMQLKYWLTGVRHSGIDLAIHVLKKAEILSTYELTDPTDKKSVYTFLSLRINAEHQWGNKQFKQRDEDAKATKKK